MAGPDSVPCRLSQARELLARVARDAHEVAYHQPLVRPAQRAIAKPAQHRCDVPVAILVLAASLEFNLRRAFKKPAQLSQRHQLLFAHVDHHDTLDDRSIRYASDAYLGGDTPPVQTHTMLKKTEV